MKLVAAACAALLVACTALEKPSGRSVEYSAEASAVVTAIDLPQRLVTLRTDDGEEVVLPVEERVRNLEKVVVGDKVVVSRTQAVAWQVKPSSKGAPGITLGRTVSTARPSDRPGGMIEQRITLTATITAVDIAHGTVTLTGPENRSRTFKAEQPADLARVKPGDLVDITYSDGVIVDIRHQ